MRSLELVPLASVKPNPKNPKRHAEKLLDKSIDRFGYAEPMMRDDRTGLLVAGHGRLEALIRAREASPAAPPDGVQLGPDGEWLVPVLTGWASKDDAEASAYLLASNRVSEEGGWHDDQLGKFLLELSGSGNALDNLVATGFTKGDVDAVLEQLAPPGDDDELPPLSPAPAAPWVEDGALYALGDHRVYVGDSLVEAERRVLLGELLVDLEIADPPYAIFGSSSGIASSIADNKMVIPFFESYWRGVAMHLREFGHSYTFTDWRSYGTLELALRRVQGLEQKNGLTWDKGGSGLGSNYAMTTEWVMFAHRLEPKRVMKASSERTGMRLVHQPNIAHHNRPAGEERLHNAAKPVALLRDYVKASSEPGARVWDPFAGSGSVLIACEREGRICLCGDSNPVNAQITIERWQRITGKKAEKLK